MRTTCKIDYGIILFESRLQLNDLPAFFLSIIGAGEVLSILVITEELHLIVREDN